MYPDLLEIFGVTLHGVMFERIVWGVGSLLMAWGILSSIFIFLKGRWMEAFVQGGIVTVLLIWLLRSFLQTFEPNYVLMFQEPIVLHTYAFCILVGIVFGILSGMSYAPYRGIDRTWYAKLCLWFVIIGFIGARAVHVLVDYQLYMDSCFEPSKVGLVAPDCWRALRVSEGGLTFYGGVISGFLVLLGGVIQLKRRRKHFSFLTLTDLLAMSLAITHSFGRIGCLAAGCCWGAITQSGFGIHYGPGSFAYIELLKDPHWAPIILETQQTPAMHPTQIYEAAAEFLIFMILFLIGRHQNKHLMGRVFGSTADDESTLRGETNQAAIKASEQSEVVVEQPSALKTGAANHALDAALAGLSALAKEEPTPNAGSDNKSSEKTDSDAKTDKKSELEATAADSKADAKPTENGETSANSSENTQVKDEDATGLSNLNKAVDTSLVGGVKPTSAQPMSAEAASKGSAPEQPAEQKASPKPPVKIHPGRMTAIWFIGYGTWRIIVEMMRDDTERGYFFEKAIEPINRLLDVDPNHITIFTTSQGIGIFMVCFGLLCLALSYRREIR